MSTRSVVVPVPVCLAAVLAAVLLLGGCGDSDDSQPAAATGPATSGTTASADAPDADAPDTDATDSADADREDAPPFPSGVTPAEQPAPADALVTVTDIRTGRHDGYDRVVFEVSGEGTPGWDVRYVDQAVQEGSGNPVEVAGAAVLQVTVRGVGYPYDTGVDEFSPGGPVPGPGRAVTEVVLGPTFEGVTQTFVGTTGQSPFRVYLLEGPTRIVVEVADPG